MIRKCIVNEGVLPYELVRSECDFDGIWPRPPVRGSKVEGDTIDNESRRRRRGLYAVCYEVTGVSVLYGFCKIWNSFGGFLPSVVIIIYTQSQFFSFNTDFT